MLVSEILEWILVSFDGIILSGARHTISIDCHGRIQKSLLITLLDRYLGNDLNLFLYMRVHFLTRVWTNNILDEFVQVLFLVRVVFLILFLNLVRIALDDDIVSHILGGWSYSHWPFCRFQSLFRVNTWMVVLDNPLILFVFIDIIFYVWRNQARLSCLWYTLLRQLSQMRGHSSRCLFSHEHALFENLIDAMTLFRHVKTGVLPNLDLLAVREHR